MNTKRTAKRETCRGGNLRAAITILAAACFAFARSGVAAPEAVLPFPAPGPGHAENRPQFEDFAGSESCARCHQKQYDLWKKSTHGQAGGPPGDAKIIARFDGQPLRFKDAVVTPTTNRLGAPVFVVERAGLPALEIQPEAAVGGGHIFGGGTQSFFQKFSDGTMRFLPFDFIRREGLWFVQLRKDLTWVPVGPEISLQSDLANWPPHRVLGTATEFSNCQNCHGSQVSLSYDERARRYETRFLSLTVNCESCHGPGRRHIDLVSRPGFEKLPDLGMTPLATLSKDESLMVCFQCHAMKNAIREEDYLPGAALEDYFSLKLALLGNNPFHVDGRVRSFDYQGNHLYSDCYLDGSMTCVDCHDPHGQGYRDVFLKPLDGRFDNGQCTGCHASKGLAPERHSHHPAGSPGNRCVSCHMPFLQHQGVGARLSYARSDHTIPIPRPAFDQQLGIENACQKCHPDKPLAWQETKAREWWGEMKPHHPAVASLLQARDLTEPQTAARFLLLPGANHRMAQTAGLATWIERFVRPNSSPPDPAAIERLKTLARGSDVDIQSLALLALHVGYDERPEVRSFLVEQLQGLDGRERLIRSRWAIAADNLGSTYAAQGDVTNALFYFAKSLEVQRDSHVTLSHLAQLRLKAGDAASAVVWLKRAIQLKPHKAALHFQLAQAHVQLGQTLAAVQALEEGLRFAPDDSRAQRMLETLRGL